MIYFEWTPLYLTTISRPSGPAQPGTTIVVVSVSLPDPLSFPVALGEDDYPDVLDGLAQSLPLRSGATAVPVFALAPQASITITLAGKSVPTVTDPSAPDESAQEDSGLQAGLPDMELRAVAPTVDGPVMAGGEVTRQRPAAVVRARSHIIRM
jgi:hypothetical protein